ncbi:MAG: tetratricopeptide repeat protein [Deltaproteobacteria bacterium]|nr:tetratricopeptide repeat protein [Candidatus Zymogenaceae bacterium]
MAKKIKVSRKKNQKDRDELLTTWEKILGFIEINERIIFIATVAVITLAIAAIVFSIVFFKRQTAAKEIFNRGVTTYHDAGGYNSDELEKALLSFSTITDSYRMSKVRPLAFLYRGHVLYDLEEYSEAAEMYRKASERLDEPLSRIAVLNRGYALEADGSYDEAAEVYKTLADADDLEAMTYLIRVLEKGGDTEEAERYSERYNTLTLSPEDLLLDDTGDFELDIEEGLDESSDDSSDGTMADDTEQ